MQKLHSNPTSSWVPVSPSSPDHQYKKHQLTSTLSADQQAKREHAPTPPSSDPVLPSERQQPSSEAVAKTMTVSADGEYLTVPALYHQAPMDLLTLLVSDLLTRLTSHNDTIPLHPTQITRFHSRRPASISITAYLQRIITHAHLTPFHLLSLLIYTDRIAKTLTLSSLTVHRFLCTAVAITSKTHFDVFYSNKVYAEIGGLPIVELNALEMELCFMLNWDLLADEGKMQRYYTSMVKRHPNLVLGA